MAGVARGVGVAVGRPVFTFVVGFGWVLGIGDGRV